MTPLPDLEPAGLEAAHDEPRIVQSDCPHCSESLRRALETIRSMFEVEYHSDGRIASVGHASDGLRKTVIVLDRTLSGASE